MWYCQEQTDKPENGQITLLRHEGNYRMDWHHLLSQALRVSTFAYDHPEIETQRWRWWLEGKVDGS